MSTPLWVFWLWVFYTLKFILMIPLRVRIEGLENVPRTGGAMMLSNHTTFFDVLVCFWGLHRPAHGIGSEQVFRLPLIGTFLQIVGGIPYAKGAKDGAAVRAMAEAYKAGGLIGMFPEGLRSWTGSPLPIRRGTGKLVKSLGCPVIYCRVKTGFLQHPRWATWPRLVPWHMEFSPAEIPEDATPERINELIAEGIAIDPAEVELPEGSWGFRLAEGLPGFLWACPACFGMESLEVASDRNCVQCTECSRRWRVDLRTHLIGETPDTESMTVATAREGLSDHFNVETPIACELLRVSRVERGKMKAESVASGSARLGETAIEVHRGDEVLWSLPYSEMKAVLLQFRNALQIRVEGANYQLDPIGQSTLRWHYFLALRCEGLVG